MFKINEEELPFIVSLFMNGYGDDKLVKVTSKIFQKNPTARWTVKLLKYH
jgi:hypothetical protein